MKTEDYKQMSRELSREARLDVRQEVRVIVAPAQAKWFEENGIPYKVQDIKQ